VSQGLSLDPSNPAAAVFRHAAGDVGLRLFGAVMWAAAMTSIVGSAYTSVSFLRTLRPGWQTRTAPMIIGFIVTSTAVFLVIGRPVAILIAVGAINAMILPLGLGAMLVASRDSGLMNGYRHPVALTLAGTAVALLMAGLGVYTLSTQLPPLFR
jgi:Mn2+/Fe2+ NRAMP family transporter